jgi:thiol-disulfide isomerase/thioredoxin
MIDQNGMVRCLKTYMTHKTLLAFFAAGALLTRPIQAQDSPDPALTALVQQVNDQIKAGKTSETDLQPELKQFDVLIAAHKKDASPDVVAAITFAKARVYLEVLGDFQTGAQLVKEIKADYGSTPYGKNADAVLAQIDEMAQQPKLSPEVASGLPFPDFTEKDLAGNPLSVAALKGKVVLIDFWATWCGPCRAELPNVISTYDQYHSQGFEIIGVSLDDQRNLVDTFLKQQKGMSWPQYYDGQGWNNKLAQKYQVKAIPCTILIGRDGKIIGTYLHGGKLKAAVADALAAK